MQKYAKLLAIAVAVPVLLAITGIFSSAQDRPATAVQSPSMPGMEMHGNVSLSALASGLVVRSISDGSWSDPSIWDGHNVPQAGDNVIVSSANTVTFDQRSSPALGNIAVDGNLIFTRDHSSTLTFANMTIDPSGYVEVGTSADPIPGQITATLQLAAATEGSSVIDVMGHLEIHGNPVDHTFVKLDRSASRGDATIIAAQGVSWRAGNHVVITSTTLDPKQTEENYVASVDSDGKVITLSKPIKYSHGGGAPGDGEIALLTRNVVITSATPVVAHAAGIMFHQGSVGGLSYVELSHLGGKDVLGAYPIHFHHAKNTMNGTLIQGVSIWDSNNRFLTIHDTDGIVVRDSVGYKSIGHGFFLEDGNEMNNVFDHNLAIMTTPGKLRPDDGGAAGFWIQNPVNDLVGNVAVSAAGSGFDLAIPEKTPDVIPFNAANFDESASQTLIPRSFKMLQFEDNEAHSNRGSGVHLYRLNATPMTKQHTPVPGSSGTFPGISWFKHLTLWRNGGTGMTITAAQANITSSTFFGNRMGDLQVDANDVTISNSSMTGELAGVASTPKVYSVSPFGLLLTGTRVTLESVIMSGHQSTGNYAYADIIQQPMGTGVTSATLVNTQLNSSRTIIFGYPLNSDSYVKVINDGLGGSYTLYRYDTDHGPNCNLSTSEMALVCPAQ